MKIKIFLVVALMIAGAVAILNFAKGEASYEEEYTTYLEMARENAKKDIPYVAIQNYRKAMSLDNSSEDIYMEYLEQCRNLSEDEYRIALEAYIEHFPNSANAYEMLCSYYYEHEMYFNVLSCALEAKDKGLATETIKNQYLECSVMYRTISGGFKTAGSFMGDYAIIQSDDDLYGFVNGGGKYAMMPKYEELTIFLAGKASVKEDGKCFVINESGFKVAVTNKDVDYLGIMNNDRALYSINGKYDYTDANYNISDKEPRFEDATAFKNGVAAVKQNGKWALMNPNLEMITDYLFEDVLRDEFNTCINNGVIFVKKDGKYYMCNAQGSKIVDTAFDNAYPFVSSEPAAVCIDGKWGFVDSAGNMVIEPQYEAAKSFNMSLGAVCKEGKWGYINTSNTLRIDYTFKDCLPFSSNGATAILNTDDKWEYIKLFVYLQ